MLSEEMTNLKFCWKVFLIFLPLSVITAGILFLIFNLEDHNFRNSAEFKERQALYFFEELIKQDLHSVTTELLALSEHHKLLEFIDQPSKHSARSLKNDWGAFQVQKKVYDQIRYLDLSGMERIRINYLNGASRSVPNEELQDKSDRYYFKESLQLNYGQVFVSPLDLNIERGEVEKPFKPMIRFGTPVVDNNEQKRGVLFINFLASKFLQRIRGELQERLLGQMMLLNSDGYWLSHPLPEKEWSFMFGESERFSTEFPLAWERFKTAKKGQFYTDDGLFTYVMISADDQSISVAPEWALVSFVSNKHLFSLSDNLKWSLIYLWLFLSLFYLYGAWLVASLISSRQRANNLAKKHKETIELILNSTMEGIYGVDERGKCIFFNLAAQDLLGYDQEKALGKNTHDLIAKTTGDESLKTREKCQVSNVIATGQPYFSDDEIFVKNDGSSLNVECRIHPITKSDRTNGAVVSFVDISDKKKLMEQRIRSGHLASVGELAAGVAHEINNPITGVINYAQLLLNRRSGGEQEKQILGNIIKEGERVAKIVRNLLIYVHRDRDLSKPTSMEEIVIEPLDLLQQQLAKDGIAVSINIDDDLPNFMGNAQELGQVVINLISNARHALNDKYPKEDPGKRLKLSATRSNNSEAPSVRLEVLDQGCGISQKNLDRVFNRFYTTKPAGVGVGLGLSLSHQIIDEHKAKIHIESEEGAYTKVCIDFLALGN